SQDIEVSYRDAGLLGTNGLLGSGVRIHLAMAQIDMQATNRRKALGFELDARMAGCQESLEAADEGLVELRLVRGEGIAGERKHGRLLFSLDGRRGQVAPGKHIRHAAGTECKGSFSG